MIKIVAGPDGAEEVELTSEEVATWEAEQAAFVPPEPPAEIDPKEKLAAFLRENPDVLELLK